MLFFIIFVSTNYKYGIFKLKRLIDYYQFTDYKIIINSNNHHFDLDFEASWINIHDELKALLFAIDYFNIQDDDFIIKFNANCSLKSHSPFLKALKNNDNNHYEVISKYFFTDIIGIRCFYVKFIEKNNDIHMDLRWEKVKSLISDKKQLYLEYLGIDISQTRCNPYTIY